MENIIGTLLFDWYFACNFSLYTRLCTEMVHRQLNITGRCPILLNTLDILSTIQQVQADPQNRTETFEEWRHLGFEEK